MPERIPVDQSHHRTSSHLPSPWLWDVSTIKPPSRPKQNVSPHTCFLKRNWKYCSDDWMIFKIFLSCTLASIIVKLLKWFFKSCKLYLHFTVCHLHSHLFPFYSSYILFFSSSPDAPHSTSIALFPVGEVSEGGSVTLTCTSDAAPPVESFAWFKGTGQQFGHT